MKEYFVQSFIPKEPHYFEIIKCDFSLVFFFSAKSNLSKKIMDIKKIRARNFLSFLAQNSVFKKFKNF